MSRPYRILVFPSCNEPGLEIVHSLAHSNKVELFGGSSINPEYDPSRLILKNHLACPHLADADFQERFANLLKEHAIDLVFPTTDALVLEFSRWQIEGTRFVTTNTENAQICASKTRTYRALAGIVPTPHVYVSDEVHLPAYAKPDSGGGAKQHMLLETPDDVRAARRKALIVSEFLPGDEYTVDCAGDLEGNLLTSHIRLRGQIARGISVGTKGLESDEINGHVGRIANLLRIAGPWFAQFKRDREGRARLLEVNARVAGSMALTRLAGVNIPLLSVFLFIGLPVEAPRPLPGVLLNRCLTNLVDAPADFSWVIWDLDDTLIRKDGKPHPDLMACLFDCHNRGIKQMLLTKNPNVASLLQKHQIPDFFVDIAYEEDKDQGLERLLNRRQVNPEDCVMINDSFTERQRMTARHPQLRVFGPDCAAMLGRERIA